MTKLRNILVTLKQEGHEVSQSYASGFTARLLLNGISIPGCGHNV